MLFLNFFWTFSEIVQDIQFEIKFSTKMKIFLVTFQIVHAQAIYHPSHQWYCIALWIKQSHFTRSASPHRTPASVSAPHFPPRSSRTHTPHSRRCARRTRRRVLLWAKEGNERGVVRSDLLWLGEKWLRVLWWII